MAAVELILTNEPDDRKRLHSALEEFAAEHSISAKALRAADLALEEYLTNVFTHGFEQRGAHAAVIRMAVDAPWLKIEVEDEGKPFNPLEHPKVDTTKPLAEKEIGGLGIHLMRQFMDDLDYRRSGRTNLLTMRKRLE